MKLCRVISPGPTGIGTRVIVPCPDGSDQEISGVLRVHLSAIEPEFLITATIEIAAEVDLSQVLLLLGDDTLRRSAEALGYDLVRHGDG